MKIIIMLKECEVSKPSALINSRENISCLSSYMKLLVYTILALFWQALLSIVATRSIGTGKTIVLLFSAAILLRV